MRAPSPNELDELVQAIESMAILISHLTWEFYQETKKENPHSFPDRPLSEKELARLPKAVPSENTLELADQVMNLIKINDTFLDRLRTILRMVDHATIEKARLHHEKLRPYSKDDPMIREVVEKLDVIYQEVKAERGNDTTVFA